MKLGKIEKGIPIPPYPYAGKVGNAKGKGRIQNALAPMEIGDSVLMSHCKRSASCVHVHGLRAWGPGNFEIRPEGNGYRLWRLR